MLCSLQRLEMVLLQEIDSLSSENTPLFSTILTISAQTDHRGLQALQKVLFSTNLTVSAQIAHRGLQAHQVVQACRGLPTRLEGAQHGAQPFSSLRQDSDVGWRRWRRMRRRRRRRGWNGRRERGRACPCDSGAMAPTTAAAAYSPPASVASVAAVGPAAVSVVSSRRCTDTDLCFFSGSGGGVQLNAKCS